MKRLKLSTKAEETVKKLIDARESENLGFIAAIDPETGETFYGRSVVESAKKGRMIKNDPRAAFFFVRVGYPSVHVLKAVNLQGYIEQDYFPKMKGHVHERNLYLGHSTPNDTYTFDFIVDTGFSGSVVMDIEAIQCIESDYLGEDRVTLAGGVEHPVGVYLADIIVNNSKINEVEITEMKGEYLIGMALMRSVCRRAVFDFANDKILFEE
ncbi:MAG: hypothetical protein CVT88_03030 [Candidatus Altiarchaeales archaeon HGW-Altiarchaeales-1]|nr:MAG: hypothetical protein CVT89_03825 [Candidatus Altiarchaeales archaeon HGW-Altiarchaeales-2]PKP60454.1 MAG: hypothetical protein CVT88_03030 [Candidatus Altiarchaeales archaeon HGW-Altiarchaeales-1]